MDIGVGFIILFIRVTTAAHDFGWVSTTKHLIRK
jgi:hypothetical protein